MAHRLALDKILVESYHIISSLNRRVIMCKMIKEDLCNNLKPNQRN